MNIPQKLSLDITPDPNVPQRQAADPAASVWVGASAGSGKTKVLTDRVLRLLLPREDGRPGTAPERILCLTFTRAAAREMALRLGKRLSDWATMPDDELETSLEHELLGRRPTSQECAAARALFARVVDVPGGLKIMTIHAFCQSVLGRFPLEAGVPPRFTPLEESESRKFLNRARDDVLTTAMREPDSVLGRAVTALAASQGDDGFGALLTNIAGERRQLHDILERHNGIEGVYHALCHELLIEPGVSEDDARREACADSAFDEPGLRRACKILAERGTKKFTGRMIVIQKWLDSDEEGRMALFDSYGRAFLTKEGMPFDQMMNNELIKEFPEMDKCLRREADRLLHAIDRIRAARCAGLTRDLLLFGAATVARYDTLKEEHAALDFDDLIERTRNLLRQDSIAGWVMYKLDGGIDHILVDEAQDTNPEQWDVVSALCEDFFAGLSAREDIERTIFVVGDEKQSIYSFQRAAPEKFSEMQRIFRRRVEEGGTVWRDVDLSVSFRSAPAILKFVDHVFAGDGVRRGLGPAPVSHSAHRRQHPGRVEVWPLFATPKRIDRDPWNPPRTALEQSNGAARLAAHIADTIAGWLAAGEMLPARGRALTPGDIMILLRSRSGLAEPIVRALKTRGLPVGGADRMVLKDQLVAQDLLAAARFALLPDDNLTLACLLKSPLIGLDDWNLEFLCSQRSTDNESLWETLKNNSNRYNVSIKYLNDLVVEAKRVRPYEFFCRVLARPCPANPVSGLRALQSRMGDEVADPVEEFLSLALDHTADDNPTLQGFIQTLTHGDTQIKREQEQSGGRIRIMTVHGAKGLQAPVVILPDTVRGSPRGAAQNTRRLLWPDKTGASVPLWSPRADSDCRAYEERRRVPDQRQEDEERRLLYVALTRAEDRLYIGGFTGLKSGGDSGRLWYDMTRGAAETLADAAAIPFESAHIPPPGEKTDSSPPVFYRLDDRFPPAPSLAPKHQKSSPAYQEYAGDHSWALRPPAPEPHPPRPLQPSRPESDGPAAASPRAGGDDGRRFRRGIVTHKLLQFLPDLNIDKRAGAARAFVARQAADLPPDIRDSVVSETLAIIDHPDWAALFGPGSRAEVPVTGRSANGRLISGQIDRMLVTEKAVWVVDYKTNRPPPAHPNGIPVLYHQQMSYYRDIVSEVYQGRNIRCFLLWTDGPQMMEVTLPA